MQPHARAWEPFTQQGCDAALDQRFENRRGYRSATESRGAASFMLHAASEVDMQEGDRTEPPSASDAEQADLRALVREHRVHFDVGPEIVMEAGERLKVGFEVRLWAVHPKGARALPGCGKCRTLVRVLERVAWAVLPQDDRATRYAIEPFAAALYDSRIVPGADEVGLTVRLVHRADYERPIDACEERCLKEIRQSLKALGAREQ